MKNGAIWLAAVFLLFNTACETDDVMGPSTAGGPEVSLTLSPQSILENGGTANVTATLSASSTSTVVVSLLLGGTAAEGQDYNISDNQISIPAGSLSASVVLTAIDDTNQNGTRTVAIQISQVAGGQFSPQLLNLNIEDDDVPAVIQLIFNEVLYDPSNSNLDGDANGDGSYSQAEDEFLEILNLGAQAVDLSGWKVYDDEALTAATPRHVFTNGTSIPPGKALVLFGGGSPTGSFGNATIVTSSTGDMNLNNAGDKVYLYDAAGDLVISFDIEPLSNNPNESYTRNPDITGEFEQHSVVSGTLFSPGTRTDGTPF